MTADRSAAAHLEAGRELVRRLLDGDTPHGRDFDACRAVLQTTSDGEAAYAALCILLEGALADPGLDIRDTQTVVGALKDLARGRVTPGELV